ncbi:MAG: polysaccharide biosynthesis protein [Ruminococcaceae bacterium]|nr:polysaccharide biosynthesis protein [Oscillospiraceae bacterium]
MAERKKQSLLNGAMVLSMAVIVVKIISVFFKIYMTYAISFEGRAYYATAYNIYTPIYSIALAGLPTAVSRMVAEYAAKERFKDVRTLMRASNQLFVTMGLVCTALVLLLAYPYALSVNMLNAIPAILTLAPSMFFCCVMSSYRGYYQGMRNMTPSAMSQIYEAAGKLIFGFVAINLVTAGVIPFLDRIPVLNNVVSDTVSAYAAAGAIAGVTIGSVFSFLYLFIRYRSKKDGITEAELLSSPESLPAKTLRKQLLTLSVPMATSAIVSNVTTLIDNWTVQNRLQYVLDAFPSLFNNEFSNVVQTLGFTATTELKDYLFGAYDTVLEFKNLVPTFTITLGLSALPVLREMWMNRDEKGIKTSIESVVRMTLMIAFPAGIGLAVLSEDVLSLFYGLSEKNALAIEHIAPVLVIYGLTVFLLAIEQPLVSMLQAVSKEKVPIVAIACGAVIKIIANFILVGLPSVNMKGAAIGSFLCNLTIDAICLFSLLKATRIKLNWMSAVLKPLFCAVCAGGAAWGVNALFEKLLGGFEGISVLNGDNIACCFAVIAAVVVYAITLLLSRSLPKSDIKMLPKGEKIAKVLEKYKLIG